MSKLTEREIKRTRPREFKEYAKLHLDGKELIYQCSDNGTTTLGYPWTFTAHRYVRKNGKPLGPWIFIHCNYGYYIRLPDEDEGRKEQWSKKRSTKRSLPRRTTAKQP